jgi:dihydrofolate synthase/folylpolyglutamate synthase
LRLGDPQDAIPIVHIAGTNGKGSVSAAVCSILGQARYRVGLNSSPHLIKINERICIDGVSCSDDLLGEMAYAVREAANRAVVELSFHEAITAVSFLAFRELGLDWGVVEVGLGGRLDASNVIKRPAATAIVTIDFDHQHILGDTLAKIAAEKAGIIKNGVPHVTGALKPEALAVVKQRVIGGAHHLFGRDYDARVLSGTEVNRFEYWGKSFPMAPTVSFEFTSPLVGVHQGHNLSVATTIGLVLGLSPDVCKRGIESVFWPARVEKCTLGGRDLVLDSAHNPAGVRALINTMPKNGKIDLTFGVLPFVSCWRLLLPESDRAVPLDLVAAEIQLSGNEVSVFRYESDYERCLRDIVADGSPIPAYIAGSMYMVGRIRGMISPQDNPLWMRAT